MQDERRALTPLGDIVFQSTDRAVTDKREDWPYLGLEHLESGSPYLLGSAHSGSSRSTNNVFREGDVLFGKLRPYLRKCIAASSAGYCSTDILVLRPNNGVDPSFAAKVCQSERVFAEAVATSIGTKMPRTSWASLRQLEVFCPPRPEQRRIGEILDTLDEAIRKTEQVIAKLQQLQQGLLHDLLTRGIDDNGELRDPDRHPEQFKDSPLGRVPREWDVRSLENLAENLDGRRIPLKQGDRDKRHGPFPYYGASGIIDWIDNFIFDGDYILLGEDGENVVSRRLPLAFRVKGRFWVNNHAHIFAPKPDVDVQFLTELLEAQDYSGIVSGSAQPKITQDGLRHLRFAVPGESEQVQIASMLSSHSGRVSRERIGLNKLRTLKHGIMDDLLTGRVRVSVPKKAAE